MNKTFKFSYETFELAIKAQQYKNFLKIDNTKSLNEVKII